MAVLSLNLLKYNFYKCYKFLANLKWANKGVIKILI